MARKDYERAARVPAAFTAEMSAHAAKTYDAWTRARPNNDFASVAPLLEKTVELSRRLAEFFPGYAHIADPIIGFSDEGLTVAVLRKLFAELRAELAPLAQAICDQPQADDSCLRQDFPETEQLAFATEVIRRYGYDFDRGRCDRTPHPFMTKFSLGDVRITTRVNRKFLGEALFSMLHETGHALYEQGIDRSYEGSALADGTSSGVHESQSRLWENLIGRSRAFWEHYYPLLQKAFPAQLKATPPDVFYRAINTVRRSLIRTDADEVTYNLHVIIRFDLECDLLEGKLAVADLPEAWNARYRDDLGMAPPDDRDGCLQDMHWYSGTVGGMFQCYTLGNILSAQFYDAAVQARPEIPQETAQGRFDALRDWLRANIHTHGRKYTAEELVQRVVGAPMSIAPYMDYLRRKYGELYAL